MKRAIFILTLGLCLLLSDGAHAQRALPAMRGLEIRGGMADGFYTRDSRSETGYWFGLAMSRYAKNADKWVFGAEFLNRYYPYKSERIPAGGRCVPDRQDYPLADGARAYPMGDYNGTFPRAVRPGIEIHNPLNLQAT